MALKSTEIKQIKSNVGVLGEGKTEVYTGKNLSEQSRQPTKSTHIWRQIRDSILSHIGGRQVLSTLLGLKGLIKEACTFESYSSQHTDLD